MFGAARSLEQLGRFDEARALYEDFIAANPDNEQVPQAESGLLFLKKAERAKNNPTPAVAAPAAAALPEPNSDNAEAGVEAVFVTEAVLFLVAAGLALRIGRPARSGRAIESLSVRHAI